MEEKREIIDVKFEELDQGDFVEEIKNRVGAFVESIESGEFASTAKQAAIRVLWEALKMLLFVLAAMLVLCLLFGNGT